MTDGRPAAGTVPDVIALTGSPPLSTGAPQPGGRRRWLGRALHGLAALLLTAASALVVVRLAGLDAGTVLALPIAGFPLLAAGTAVLLGVLLCCRSRRWLTGWAVVLVAVEVAVVVPRFVPAAPDVPAGVPRLRVATVNTQHGRVDPAALVELVRMQRVDVLAVQEPTPAGIRALDLAGLRTLLPHHARWPGSDSALYARQPLAADARTPVPTTWPPTAASITVGGRAVRVVAVRTYYPAGDPGRWQRDLTALRAEAGPDVVLLGDLNATVDHAPLRDLLAAGLTDAHDELGRGWAPTWPTDRRLPPLLQLDHVLYGPGLVAVSASEHTLPGTDHRAVVADLALVG